MGSPTTYAALISAFCDFLIVAIHTITYERNLYPATSYLSARKYNFPVRQSRHPKVCQWISDAVAAIETELFNDRVAQIAVVITASSGKPYERFVFDVSNFPTVASEEIHTPLESRAAPSGKPNVDLEEQFRAVMSTLSTCGSRLGPLPTGCSFTVAFELKDMADPPLGHPQPWIPAEPSLQRRIVNDDGVRQEAARGDDLGGVKVSPLRAVDIGNLAFEMWVEETRAKEEQQSQETRRSNASSQNYR